MKYIDLTQSKQAIVSDEDFAYLRRWKWRILTGNNQMLYAISPLGLMHRVIMRAPEGMVVDHIDNDGLNNRRSNLLVCTISENQQNLHYVKSKSGYRGIYWDDTKNAWRAYITINQQRIYLGQFKLLEDASKVRREAEKIYFTHPKFA